MLWPDDVIKLILAVLIGGLIGAEREFRDKAAGFRTIIFICVGATLFTIVSLKIGGDKDPVRVAANIVSGVGFLGAGAILRDTGHIVGLTTASTIWLAAALGMGIGGGQITLASVATGVVLVVLWLFPRIEIWIDDLRHAITYEIVIPIGTQKLEELEDLFKECGLQVRNAQRAKKDRDMICCFEVYGSPADHDRLVEKLFLHADVKEFRT